VSAETERTPNIKRERRTARLAIIRNVAMYAAISAAVTGAILWWFASFDWEAAVIIFFIVLVVARLGHGLWNSGWAELRGVGKVMLFMSPWVIGVYIFETDVRRLGVFEFFAVAGAYIGLLWLIERAWHAIHRALGRGNGKQA
jgi:hypothetical protein